MNARTQSIINLKIKGPDATIGSMNARTQSIINKKNTCNWFIEARDKIN